MSHAASPVPNGQTVADAWSPVAMSPDDSDDGGYVHRPSGEPPQQAETSDAFGREGWVLVGMILLGFLVIPISILLLPAAQGIVRSFGLTLRAAYLALPLVPAFLLGAIAVWSALRSRQS